uniref:Pectinesterase inhibitor domain-containing protein n=1 Tax=Ananas comosus var. bracteatus TaxID=296719 RepID=A0A6V7QRB8_ANACO
MSSDPRTADAVLFLLTNISIDHALANAFDTYAAVKKMYDADAATEPKLKACLLSCETEYYLAVSHLQSAIQYLAEKNYFDGISALQSAFDDVTTCEDTFNDPRFQPVKSPLIQKNQIAEYLCNISFEFERLLEPSTKTLLDLFNSLVSEHMNQRKSSNLVSLIIMATMLVYLLPSPLNTLLVQQFSPQIQRWPTMTYNFLTKNYYIPRHVYVKSGHQLYRECKVYRTVNFVFGNMQAIFKCCIFLARKSLLGQQNVTTAQGSETASVATGFILQNCSMLVTPDLKPVKNYITFWASLEAYSRTIIMQSFIDNLIHPSGVA